MDKILISEEFMDFLIKGNVPFDKLVDTLIIDANLREVIGE